MGVGTHLVQRQQVQGTVQLNRTRDVDNEGQQIHEQPAQAALQQSTETLHLGLQRAHLCVRAQVLPPDARGVLAEHHPQPVDPLRLGN